MITKYPILKHLFYWLLAFGLLTFIYGTAFGSYTLGTRVILMLLPVHMCYFYLIANWIMPRLFFQGKYIRAFFAVVVLMFLIALLYRLTEMYIADPYVYRFYKSTNEHFTWEKLVPSRWEQLKNQVDFVNAIERSNVVVWILVTLNLFILWNERKHAVLQAELNLLKGQLHPHFLFNALNNLYALSLENAPQTPGVILGLSNILRYVLYECTADQVLLKRDIEVLNDYIKLEQIRYEERLELNVTISDNAGNRKIAPLLMLPLVENAFKHGAAESIETPWINIELYITGNDLLLKISNSIPENTVTDGKSNSGRIGLLNVRKRLELLYPGKHLFSYSDEGDCFITELKVQLSASNNN